MDRFEFFKNGENQGIWLQKENIEGFWYQSEDYPDNYAAVINFDGKKWVVEPKYVLDVAMAKFKFSSDDLYEESLRNEDYMRANMYKPEFKTDPMNKDPYYNLYNMETVWPDLVIESSDYPNLLFAAAEPISKDDFAEIQGRMAKFQPLLDLDNVLIAGGAVFGTLFDQPYDDVDLFIWGLDEQSAEQKIYEIARTIQNGDYIKEINRTNNAVTIKTKNTKYQIILRLYRTVSEVLHGFDVDSCAVGMDKYGIFATGRAISSYQISVNRVNFDRLSPSYPWRLTKYGQRGMAVFVPDLDIRKYDEDALIEAYPNLSDITGWRSQIKGLDLLMALNYWYGEPNDNIRKIPNIVRGFVKTKANNVYVDATSDYSAKPTYISDERLGDVLDDITYGYESSKDLNKKNASNIYNRLKKEKPELLNNYSIGHLIGSRKGNAPKSIHASYFNIDNDNLDEALESVLHVPYEIREILQNIYDMSKSKNKVPILRFPADIQFKVTNPGEQMTNTFNREVLANPAVWYQSEFYNP